MTRPHKLLLSCLVLGGAVTAAYALRSAGNTVQPASKPAADAAEKADPDHEAILQHAKAFLTVYNKHDAKSAAMYFAPDAEMIELDGDVVRGRKAIQEAFAAGFKANPKGKISIAVDSVRRVAPTVMIEQGRLTTYPDGKNPSHDSRYQVVHVKTGGKWLMAHVRTLDVEAISHHEHLKDLEWMIGHWVDEAEGSVTETTCEWSKDKNWLLRKFTVKIDDQPAMHGVQRIGYDPLTKQIKSWVFDSRGGYVEGLWSNVGDHWVSKARGVSADGTVVTSTNQFSYLGKDRMRWVSVHRMAGDRHLPDVVVTVTRKPPAPKGKK